MSERAKGRTKETLLIKCFVCEEMVVLNVREIAEFPKVQCNDGQSGRLLMCEDCGLLASFVVKEKLPLRVDLLDPAAFYTHRELQAEEAQPGTTRAGGYDIEARFLVYYRVMLQMFPPEPTHAPN